jgi:hypothetical protein
MLYIVAKTEELYSHICRACLGKEKMEIDKERQEYFQSLLT